MTTAEPGSSAPFDKTREVRLGLVMYGGISLAIYINGVANELFRAVRGRGAYRLIKRLTRSDVVVDVMSGSSAGGINGIFLSYALCNEVEFGSFAGLWREHGDIDRLLRPTDGPLDEYRSLLDSEGYYQPKLEEAFAKMAKLKIGPSPTVPEDPSRIEELDLLITGTDFSGRVYDQIDDRGDVVQVKDHRALFWLKHRSGRKQPFSTTSKDDNPPGDAGDPQTHAALSKLARITSCFPAAFAPVTVEANDAGVDGRLRRWAGLKDPNARVFIDGGVLDNKPFTSTLDVIYHRLSERPVARYLIYVEPDPERFGVDGAATQPNVVKTAVDSLTRLPSYESIADDLRELSKHNDQVARFKQVTECAEAGQSPGSPAMKRVYLNARLIGLTDGVFAELFETQMRGVGTTNGDATRLRQLREMFNAHYVDNDTDTTQLLQEFDIDYRIRRLFNLRYSQQEALLENSVLLKTINNQLQVLEIVRSAMQAAIVRVAREPFEDAEKTWALVRKALKRVLTVTPPLDYARPTSGDVLLEGHTREEFRKRLAEAVASDLDVKGQTTLLTAIDLFEATLVAAAVARPGKGAALVKAYQEFEQLDLVLHPLEIVSGIREKDVIRTVRVSPVDAQAGLCDRPIEKKVTGINLGHFGAFFKRSWRSNDILWGRLDSACELVDVLMDDQRCLTLAGHASAGWDQLSAEELKGYLPCLSEERRGKLSAALRRMAQPGAGAAELPIVKDLILEGLHHEILADGLPQVVEDAAWEQMRWNEFREGKRSTRAADAKAGAGPPVAIDPASMRFVAGKQVFDPAVVAISAGELAKDAIAGLARAQPPQILVEIFHDRYRVGEETIDDIPRIVLLDIVARAMLVVRNCLLSSLGPRAERIRDSFLFKVTFDWPLRFLAALVSAVRRAPATRGAFVLGSLLYTAISLVVVVEALDLASLRELPAWGAGLFVALPMLLLGSSAFLVTTRGGDSGLAKAGRALWLAVRMICVAAVVVVFVGLWRTSSATLCNQVVELVSLSPDGCTSPWISRGLEVGKVLVLIGAVLVSPLARVGSFFRWLSRRSVVNARQT